MATCRKTEEQTVPVRHDLQSKARCNGTSTFVLLKAPRGRHIPPAALHLGTQCAQQTNRLRIKPHLAEKRGDSDPSFQSSGAGVESEKKLHTLLCAVCYPRHWMAGRKQHQKSFNNRKQYIRQMPHHDPGDVACNRSDSALIMESR